MAETAPRTRVKTTCPRDCYDACGIVVVKEGDTVRKVVGDPDHPVARGVLCGKCAIAYNGVFRDPERRLQTPLKRVGAKGEGRFVPIEWDEALGLVADRLGAIAAAGRPETILHTHYTGTVALLSGWFPIRFFRRLGATEVDPDTVCNKAGHVTLEHMFGCSLDGFDPRSATEGGVILVWGANPSHAAPHQHRNWLFQAGAEVIAIDPIKHDTAARADLHLQPRPGTDAALAFAMLHVLERENLVDRAYVDAHSQGYEALADDIAAATPAWGEAVTGVPAARIEDAARRYARGPSLLWLGQGLQRQPRGGNAFRAIATLAVAAGQLGKPGTGFCYMNGPQTRGIDMDVLVPPDFGASAAISHMDLASTLEDPTRASALVHWNNNILASSPEQGRLRRALGRDDVFQVSVELFHTDTTAFADVVLPAASFLEFDDLVAPYFDQTLAAQVQVMPTMGTALPNQEIFRRLAGAMGFTEPELFEDDATLLARLLADTPFDGGFAELAAAGTVRLFEQPRPQFADGVFATPSGKIEIECPGLEALGLETVPQPHADAPPAAGRLRILSPANAWLMNSSYGNDDRIRDKLAEPAMLVHPADLEALGLADGDAVRVANDTGALDVVATASEKAQPGMAVIYKGRWPDGGANVNALNPGRKSDVAESSCVHGVEVEVRVPEAAE